MTTRTAFACATCARLHANDVDDPGEQLTCDAFPDGIPDEILSGQNRHTTPFDGDNGLTYLSIFESAT